MLDSGLGTFFAGVDKNGLQFGIEFHTVTEFDLNPFRFGSRTIFDSIRAAGLGILCTKDI